MPPSVVALRAKIVEFLKSGHYIDSIVDDNGNSLLHLVMEHDFDDDSILWSLLSRGPHMNISNHDGFTPFETALESGNQCYMQIFQKVLSFRKYLRNAANYKRPKDLDCPPCIAWTDTLDTDSLPMELQYTRFLLGAVHEDYLDWSEDTTYAHQKGLVDSMIADERFLKHTMTLMKEKLAENLLDLEKTEEILRDKRYQVSLLIWKSVRNEKNQRQALENMSIVIQALKDEIELAREAVRWEGVVEYCNLSMPFFKLWRPMYMTISNGEVCLQDLSALPPQYGETKGSYFSFAKTSTKSRSGSNLKLRSFTDVFASPPSLGSNSEPLFHVVPVSAITNVANKGIVEAKKISQSTSTAASSIATHFCLDSSHRASLLGTNAMGEINEDKAKWRRVTLNLSCDAATYQALTQAANAASATSSTLKRSLSFARTSGGNIKARGANARSQKGNNNSDDCPAYSPTSLSMSLSFKFPTLRMRSSTAAVASSNARDSDNPRKSSSAGGGSTTQNSSNSTRDDSSLSECGPAQAPPARPTFHAFQLHLRIPEFEELSGSHQLNSSAHNSNNSSHGNGNGNGNVNGNGNHARGSNGNNKRLPIHVIHEKTNEKIKTLADLSLSSPGARLLGSAEPRGGLVECDGAGASRPIDGSESPSLGVMVNVNASSNHGAIWNPGNSNISHKNNGQLQNNNYVFSTTDDDMPAGIGSSISAAGLFRQSIVDVNLAASAANPDAASLSENAADAMLRQAGKEAVTASWPNAARTPNIDMKTLNMNPREHYFDNIKNYRPDYKGFLSALRTLSEKHIPVVSTSALPSQRSRQQQSGKSSDEESDSENDHYKVENLNAPRVTRRANNPANRGVVKNHHNHNTSNNQGNFTSNVVNANNTGGVPNYDGSDQEDRSSLDDETRTISDHNSNNNSSTDGEGSNKFSDVSYTSKLSTAIFGGDVGEDDGIRIETWEHVVAPILTSARIANRIKDQSMSLKAALADQFPNQQTTTTAAANNASPFLDTILAAAIPPTTTTVSSTHSTPLTAHGDADTDMMDDMDLQDRSLQDAIIRFAEERADDGNDNDNSSDLFPPASQLHLANQHRPTNLNPSHSPSRSHSYNHNHNHNHNHNQSHHSTISVDLLERNSLEDEPLSSNEEADKSPINHITKSSNTSNRDTNNSSERCLITMPPKMTTSPTIYAMPQTSPSTAMPLSLSLPYSAVNSGPVPRMTEESGGLVQETWSSSEDEEGSIFMTAEGETRASQVLRRSQTLLVDSSLQSNHALQFSEVQLRDDGDDQPSPSASVAAAAAVSTAVLSPDLSPPIIMGSAGVSGVETPRSDRNGATIVGAAVSGPMRSNNNGNSKEREETPPTAEFSVSNLRTALKLLRDKRDETESLLMFTVESRERYYELLRYLQTLAAIVKATSIAQMEPPDSPNSGSNQQHLGGSSSPHFFHNLGPSALGDDSPRQQSLASSSLQQQPQEIPFADEPTTTVPVQTALRGHTGSNKYFKTINAMGVPPLELLDEFQLVMTVLEKRLHISVELFDAMNRLKHLRRQIAVAKNSLNPLDSPLDRPGSIISRLKEEDLYDIEF